MNIYGASGHAKVIVDIILSVNGEIDHIFDDNLAIKQLLNFKVTHNVTDNLMKRTTNIIGIGNNATRKRISSKITGEFHPYVAHPSAVISPLASIGRGTVVMANASVNAEAEVGCHCIVNTGAVVEHEVVLEDYVHIAPNTSIAGDVFIGEGSHVGIGASVIQGIRIGRWATIGAGAVIIEDVPDFATVVGNPGRIIRINESEGIRS